MIKFLFLVVKILIHLKLKVFLWNMKILLLPLLFQLLTLSLVKSLLPFINQKNLLSNLEKEKNHNKTCQNEKNIEYDLIDLKPDKNLKGHIIGNEIRNKLNPIIKKYCYFLLSKLDGNNKKASTLKKDIKKFYSKLVKTNYLLGFHKDEDDSDHAYATSISVIPTLFVYSHMRSSFDKNEIKQIDEMFKKLVKKNEYMFSNKTGVSRYNNHAYYNNNLRLMVSIVTNDLEMYNESISFFYKQMRENKTDTGLFKFDSKRGECALHYNLHVLSPLMSTLWNLDLQNIDIQNTKLNGSHTIDEIVSIVIDAVNDPRIVIKQNKKLGYTEAARKTCSPDTDTKNFGSDEIRMPYESTFWFAPYFSLTNNIENKDKFIDSMLSNKYSYDGQADSSFVSYFMDYIYLDQNTNKPIEVFKSISFDDLDF